jgi:hypothetical protein
MRGGHPVGETGFKVSAISNLPIFRTLCPSLLGFRRIQVNAIGLISISGVNVSVPVLVKEAAGKEFPLVELLLRVIGMRSVAAPFGGDAEC